jgi:hypothetical protein
MTSVSNFDTLIHKFKENSITHPNISRFWITYLELKKKSFETLLEQGLSVIEQIKPLPHTEESLDQDHDDSPAAENEERSIIQDIEIKDLINMLFIKMIF